ncbi:DUF6588 family protein [uncultured Winogradskyella sp.]|uniref:DUF6588 family protein n=1 Tax=Winogradskyella sp. 4-2091 TaxID=3381659 RepID=UPI002601FEA6|nr:DUF6588 family protein [uncultured Winogradskyella sp.]
MKKIIATIVLISCFQFAKAQDLETILLAADDASLLSQNYLNPAMEGLMYSMNGGWATTAKVHKKFGFDLTIGVNASLVPEEAKAFAFIPSDYSYLSLPNNESEIQTIMSEDDTEVMVDVEIPNGDGTFKVVSFTMPGGITEDLPVNAVPAPTVQVGFGLPFKTDIKARFVPTQSYDDVEAKLLGFGLQHDLTQYLGIVDKSPLSVSILGAFTNMSVTYAMSDEDASDNVQVMDGEAEFKMNTWTVQALASLDFKLLTIYGSAGYNSGKTTTKMKGDYILTYDIEDENGNTAGLPEDVSVTDPINLDFETSGMRATLGARINLSIFKIFADYTFQEYNTATVGIAFSVR